jgi:D-glycero-D-manno-heptose 1,7-bisphosphate phosphatase
MNRRAVFIDRDGVINRSDVVDGIPRPPRDLDNVEIINGVVEAIQTLVENDYLPVVITNQPDVARGKTSQLLVKEINEYVGRVTGIEHFYTCFHDGIDKCECRKPLPGLIYKAAIDLDLDISNSFLVGDRWSDISAGHAAGCTAFFIDYSYPGKRPDLPYIGVSSLMEAVTMIIKDFNELD